eukprot:XP_001609387.1 hypothetical protein [Babesia bovis T2Bo]
MEIDSMFEKITGIPSRNRSKQQDIIETQSSEDGRPEIPKRSNLGRKSRFDFAEPRCEFEKLNTFASLTRRKSDFQDLTHHERQELQRLEAHARLSDPRSILNKNRGKVDPRREAKSMLGQLDKLDGPPNYMDEDVDDHIGAAMMEENRFDEVVSRIRAQIRSEKQENSKINKATIPTFNGVIVDPIAKHVQRRRLRINAMIQDHLEQIITANDPSLLLGDVKGASISLKKVEMASGKSTIRCYYTILGGDGKEAYIHQMLQQAQKKIRYFLARKLELGYTPPVLFIKANHNEISQIKRAASLPENAFNLPLETKIKSLGDGFHKRMAAF